jgi:hypothetical protein
LTHADEFLLQQLSSLLDEIDPVPRCVLAQAYGAFRPIAEASEPCGCCGDVGEPDLTGLAELLGPPG